jgi:putative multiple sugar transport system permease protein
VIMALGMLLVIVSGHIDLSVGSGAGFIGALAAIMMVRSGINSLLAAILCLIVGAAVGAAQGYWIAYHKIPSFIVTLSGMLVFRGLTLALLGGNSVGPFPREFQLLSSGFIPDPFARTGVSRHYDGDRRTDRHCDVRLESSDSAESAETRFSRRLPCILCSGERLSHA